MEKKPGPNPARPSPPVRNKPPAKPAVPPPIPPPGRPKSQVSPSQYSAPLRDPGPVQPRYKVQEETAKPEEKKKQRSRLGNLLLRTVLWGGGASAVAGGAGGVYLYTEAVRDLPDVATLADYMQPAVTRVLARDGSELGVVYREKRTPVAADTLPDHVKYAILAAEDRAFYQRDEGISVTGIARAAVTNVGRVLKNERLHGASTIQQQVIKNTIGTKERSLVRKAREIVLSSRLNGQMSKDDILGLYMNNVSFGDGIGIEEAAKSYFGASAKDLSLGQAALLAACVKAPNGEFSIRTVPGRTWEGRNSFENVTGRRDDYVLDGMVKMGVITPEQAAAAKAEPLEILPRRSSSKEPEIVDMVGDALRELVGEDAYKMGGYTVTTGIDPALQAAARKSVRDNLPTYDKDSKTSLQTPFRAKASYRSQIPGGLTPFAGTPKPGGVYVATVTGTNDEAGTITMQVGSHTGVLTMDDIARYNPSGLPPSKAAEEGAKLRVTVPYGAGAVSPDKPVNLSLEDWGPQAALVSIDVQSAEIRAIVGSYEGGFGLNRAADVKRQPGSGFKPVHYSYALQEGDVSPVSIFQVLNEKTKAVEPMTFRRGVETSNNDVAKAVFNTAAPNTKAIKSVLSWAKALGIDTAQMQPDRSLALGSYEITPLQMAGAYTVFARGGKYVEPRLILSVTDRDGKDVKLKPREEREVMSPATAWTMTDILKGAIEDGTAVRAKPLRDATGQEMAGKTGTTNHGAQTRDVWFNGYTPDIVTTVWSGYDKHAAGVEGMGAGLYFSGGRFALPIWSDYMKVALEGRPRVEFVKPADLEELDYDPASGHIYAEDTGTTIIPAEIPLGLPVASDFEPETFDSSRDCPGGEVSTVSRALADEEPKEYFRCTRAFPVATLKAPFIANALPRLLDRNPPEARVRPATALEP